MAHRLHLFSNLHTTFDCYGLLLKMLLACSTTTSAMVHYHLGNGIKSPAKYIHPVWLPRKLQSDNGDDFVSHFVELCSSLKIRIIHELLLKFSFERSSRHCSIVDRGDVAVWPSDEIFTFMRDSSSKHEPRTETFEKCTYPTDFWSSDDTHSGT